ncbi:hypothetical protein QJQ45_004677 [Haematococcus lacustris]|nr:hypothetical protein QJQ45_004677 [Haematococcus lacustris]
MRKRGLDHVWQPCSSTHHQWSSWPAVVALPGANNGSLLSQLLHGSKAGGVLWTCLGQAAANQPLLPASHRLLLQIQTATSLSALHHLLLNSPACLGPHTALPLSNTHLTAALAQLARHAAYKKQTPPGSPQLLLEVLRRLEAWPAKQRQQQQYQPLTAAPCSVAMTAASQRALPCSTISSSHHAASSTCCTPQPTLQSQAAAMAIPGSSTSSSGSGSSHNSSGSGSSYAQTSRASSAPTGGLRRHSDTGPAAAALTLVSTQHPTSWCPHALSAMTLAARRQALAPPPSPAHPPSRLPSPALAASDALASAPQSQAARQLVALAALPSQHTQRLLQHAVRVLALGDWRQMAQCLPPLLLVRALEAAAVLLPARKKVRGDDSSAATAPPSLKVDQPKAGRASNGLSAGVPHDVAPQLAHATLTPPSAAVALAAPSWLRPRTSSMEPLKSRQQAGVGSESAAEVDGVARPMQEEPAQVRKQARPAAATTITIATAGLQPYPALSSPVLPCHLPRLCGPAPAAVQATSNGRARGEPVDLDNAEAASLLWSKLGRALLVLANQERLEAQLLVRAVWAHQQGHVLCSPLLAAAARRLISSPGSFDLLQAVQLATAAASHQLLEPPLLPAVLDKVARHPSLLTPSLACRLLLACGQLGVQHPVVHSELAQVGLLNRGRG